MRPSAPAKAGGSASAGGSAQSEPELHAQPALADDVAETLADEIARRTELLMVAQRGKADAREFEIDRMRTEFDLHEQERAELLREWNLTRDLAMEQMKKDDENVKKWIALI
jgi:glycerol-3-phosphate dehydrogenase